MEDLNLFQVRNKFGQMVLLGTLVHPREIAGPIAVPRYNLYTAASVSGNIKTGTSTGDAIKTIDAIAGESLPLSMKADWTELMFLQKRAGDTSIYVFFLAIVSVFLALSALYESWSLPLAVILVVPLCLLCSVAGVLFTRRDVNIFVQIGLVVLVGLACKNAILVVEYAKQLHLRRPLGIRGDEGSLAAAAAADPHDLVRIHLRSDSLDDRFGGRGGDAPLAGDRRLQRHVRRDVVRHLPDAGVLLRHYRAGRVASVRFRRFAMACLLLVRRPRRLGRRLLAGETRRRSSSLVGHRRGLRRRARGAGDSGDSAENQAQGGRIRSSPCRSPCPFGIRWRTARVIRFFVDRPIFSTVISVVFVLAGGVAVFTLPVAQYPEVTPPTVLVTAFYPGANALTVQDTVAAPIEEQVSGVEGMAYMSSRCTNDGAYNLTVTFKLGTDSDMAQVLVQNRVSLALPVIPPLVQNEGINVRKMSPNTLMIVNLISPNGKYNDLRLSNYATVNVKDELGRLPGVAGITYLGQRDYSMRVWLDADKMAALNLSAMDVVTAISQQNVQVAAGQIGQQPVPKGQQFQLTINTLGRLIDPEAVRQYHPQGRSEQPAGRLRRAPLPARRGKAVPRARAAATPPVTGVVRLRDVARVEQGSQQYDQSCTLDGKPSVALSIYQLPGSNALETAAGVYAKMKDLKTRFPEGLDYEIVYDTTPFIRESVNEVFYTLRDAVLLVAIVVLLFLQDWKAMILPMIDVPVSLIGTFAIMAAMGFTLNNLTLFGLVLAIGIVVDDAIVVLENIERQMATGLDARTATIKAMEEITGPVLAITLVLSSVFIPCCFLGGVSGQFFRQFAVTISVSTIISAVNALTMTPSRAVVIFRSEEGETHGHRREALPWWIFAIVGGILTYYAAPEFLAGKFNLSAALFGHHAALPNWLIAAIASAVYILPGALVGGMVGWIVIRPVNAVLGFFVWRLQPLVRLDDDALWPDRRPHAAAERHGR